MPEGDTIFVLAARLRPVLVSQPLMHAEAPFGGQVLLGRAARAIEARGKHLLIHLDDDTSLHAHLGMTGKVRVHLLNQPIAAPTGQLTLDTQRHRVVGHRVPTLEHLTASGVRRHPHLSQLGPDLLSETFEAASVALRFGSQPYLALGEALLDQRLTCGIGNVYKSEVLFLCGVDPFKRILESTPAQVAGLLDQARALMRLNIGPDAGMRRTRHEVDTTLDGGRYWVYDRAGQPCRRCATPIRVERQGDLGRSTFFCAECQGTGARGAPNFTPVRSKC